MTGRNPRGIGRFTVLRELPGGGMSEVYLVADGGNGDREVVLKLLPRRLARDTEYRDRFMREMRTLIGLPYHPHIVGVIASGEDRTTGQLYLVMDYVDGCDLQRMIDARGTLAPEEAVRVVRQMCRALADNGDIVHRDIKPGNIMIHHGDRKTTELHGYLLDFGIARPVVGARDITQTGSAIGTLPYMAPERFDGRSKADSRVDVYALCCVLFEALTGRPAFDQRTEDDLVAAHRDRRRRPRPSEVDPSLEAFDAVVRKGLATNPAERHPVAADLADDLDRALAVHRSTPPRPRTSRPAAPTVVPVPETPGRSPWYLRLPHWVGMSTMAAGVVVGLSAGAGTLASAVVAVAGYGVGAAGATVLRRDQDRDPSRSGTLNVGPGPGRRRVARSEHRESPDV